jgi:hypothetical protein
VIGPTGTRCHIFSFVGPREKIRINGRIFSGPCLVARRAKLVELSVAGPSEAADKESYLLLHGTWEYQHFINRALPDAAELLNLRIAHERQRLAREEAVAAAAKTIEALAAADRIVQAEQARELRAAWAASQHARRINEQRTVEDHERERMRRRKMREDQ